MLKKYTFSEWLYLFWKEWVLPTVGKASGIVTVAVAIFNIPAETNIPAELERNIGKLYDLTSSAYYGYGVIVALIVLMAMFVTANRTSNPDGFWSAFSKRRPLASTVVNFLLGAVFLPLVVGITALVMQRQSVSFLVPLMAAYVLLSAAVHWVGLSEMHAQSGVIYVVSTATPAVAADLRYRAATRLQHHVGYCKGAGPVEVLCETGDFHVCLFVPLDRDATKLESKHLAYWYRFLERIEAEWRAGDISFERRMSAFIDVKAWEIATHSALLADLIRHLDQAKAAPQPV